MKQLRPKLSEAEINLLIEAMEQAGYQKQNGPKYRILQRFKTLRKGGHSKDRIFQRPKNESPRTTH